MSDVPSVKRPRKVLIPRHSSEPRFFQKDSIHVFISEPGDSGKNEDMYGNIKIVSRVTEVKPEEVCFEDIKNNDLSKVYVPVHSEQGKHATIYDILSDDVSQFEKLPLSHTNIDSTLTKRRDVDEIQFEEHENTPNVRKRRNRGEVQIEEHKNTPLKQTDMDLYIRKRRNMGGIQIEEHENTPLSETDIDPNARKIRDMNKSKIEKRKDPYLSQTDMYYNIRERRDIEGIKMEEHEYSTLSQTDMDPNVMERRDIEGIKMEEHEDPTLSQTDMDPNVRERRDTGGIQIEKHENTPLSQTEMEPIVKKRRDKVGIQIEKHENTPLSQTEMEPTVRKRRDKEGIQIEEHENTPLSQTEMVPTVRKRRDIERSHRDRDAPCINQIVLVRLSLAWIILFSIHTVTATEIRTVGLVQFNNTLRCFPLDSTLLHVSEKIRVTCGDTSDRHKYPLSYGKVHSTHCSTPDCEVVCTESFCDVIFGSSIPYQTCYCAIGDHISRNKNISDIKNVNVEAKLGNWSGWSPCNDTSKGRVRTRTRTCDDSKPYSNKDCGNHTLTDLRNCEENSIKGQWENWGNWSDCSKTCGGGIMNRTRSCLMPDYADLKCDGNKIESKECNIGNCTEKNPTGELGTPIIIGIVIAVFMVLVVFPVVVCYLIKRRKTKHAKGKGPPSADEDE